MSFFQFVLSVHCWCSKFCSHPACFLTTSFQIYSAKIPLGVPLGFFLLQSTINILLESYLKLFSSWLNSPYHFNLVSFNVSTWILSRQRCQRTSSFLILLSSSSGGMIERTSSQLLGGDYYLVLPMLLPDVQPLVYVVEDGQRREVGVCLYAWSRVGIVSVLWTLR